MGKFVLNVPNFLSGKINHRPYFIYKQLKNAILNNIRNSRQNLCQNSSLLLANPTTTDRFLKTQSADFPETADFSTEESALCFLTFGHSQQRNIWECCYCSNVFDFCILLGSTRTYKYLFK